MLTENDIHLRRGNVMIHIDFLKTADTQTLSTIFSNIYPIGIEAGHASGYYNEINYYCVSEHFEKITPGTVCPRYEITLTRTKTGMSFKAKKVD